MRRILPAGLAAAFVTLALRSMAPAGGAAPAAEGDSPAAAGTLAFGLESAPSGLAGAAGAASSLRLPPASFRAPAPSTAAPPARAAPLQRPDPSICEYLSVRGQYSSVPESNHAFYFTRGVYSSYSGWGRGGGSWSVDWPKSDCQFNVVLRRLTNIDSYQKPHPVALDDPALLRYPYLYILEVGRIALSPGEVSNLRDYLLKGGFLLVDDFWGASQWYPFEDAMRQVLPEYPIEELTLDHEYFNSFYQVDSIVQVPNERNARYGVTTECAGCYPEVYGIFDDKRRLMVVINWNTDLGDAWEWAEQPYYPVKYSTYAFEVGVNAIIYAMSH